MSNLNINLTFILVLYLSSWTCYGQTAIEYYHIANEKRESKDYEKAIQYYNESLLRNTNLANAYAERGYCFSNLKEHKKALLDYNKAIELGLQDKLVFLNRGWTFYNLGMKEKACIDWKKAEELGYTSVKKILEKYCTEISQTATTEANND